MKKNKNVMSVKENEDLKYDVKRLREELWNAIIDADYNLLDEKVQSISRQLDVVIDKIMKLGN